MSIQQISVFLENKPGELNAMTRTLAEHRIDMRALSLSETNEFGIARIIVDRPGDAVAVLKSAGYIATIMPVAQIKGCVQPPGQNPSITARMDHSFGMAGTALSTHRSRVSSQKPVSFFQSPRIHTYASAQGR